MMNIFYNSPHYVIVAYPLQQGLELVDKIDSRSLFVLGPLARELRKAIVEVPADDRSQESIDALLDEYCAGAMRPIIRH